MLELDILYKLRATYESDREKFRKIYAGLSKDIQSFIASHWYFKKTPEGKMGTRLEQILPWHESWFTTIWKPGRRWGKTTAGSNNIVDDMLQNPGIGWIGVGASFTDVKKVMIESDSGIINTLKQRGYHEQDGSSRDKPDPGHFIYNSSGVPKIVLDNGSHISFYSAEKASKLRGQGVSRVWLDEVFTFFEEEAIEVRNRKINAIWAQSLIVLSKAKNPRILISSTSTPVELLKKLYKDMKDRPGKYRYVVGALMDNPWLSDEYKAEMVRELGNTKFGRQELYGEECWEVPGALWNVDLFKYIEDTEFNKLDIVRTLIAIDPAATASKDSDETGIVVVAKSRSKEYYVLNDSSFKGSPRQWAEKAIKLYDRYKADRIVYESNQGGDMVAETIKNVRRNVPLKAVRASKGKYARAEPIAALYEQGKVFHVGMHTELEKQLCEYNPEMFKGSPDRLDALVWGLHELSTTGEYGVFRV